MGSIAIYGLFDPASPAQIRYVGKANQPESRLNQHIRKAQSGAKLPVSAWIRSVLKAGRRPGCKVLAYCTALSWEETETRLIRMHLENGHRLCNVSGGGGAGYVAKRALMAAKLAGIKTGAGHSAIRMSGARKYQPSKR